MIKLNNIHGLSIPQSILSEESTDILKRINVVNNNYFFKKDHILNDKLIHIQPIELTKILHFIFLETVQTNSDKDSFKTLDRLASLIPFAKLQETAKKNVEDVLKEAKAMFEEAELFLHSAEHLTTSSSFRQHLSTVLNSLVLIAESLITVCGMEEFFKPSDNEMQSQFRTQKIMVLFSLFSMMTTMILPLFGGKIGSLAIGGAVFCLMALSLVWNHIKPMPTFLPANAENVTKEVQNGGSSFVNGRKQSLDEIAAILKMNRHAILVGRSRVGKTLTAKAFAQAIENGDYPELRGKKVFRLNTADLLGQKTSYLGGGVKILDRISDAMGRHRDDIILVLDEIHMACKNDEKIAEQLKTFLDEGGGFSHVIGITTEEEYEKHVRNNHAFSLRFDRVEIESTDRQETLKILSDTLLKSKSLPLLEEDSLNYIYEKSTQVSGTPQPAASLKLLKRCVSETAKTQQSPTEKMITETSNKILFLRSLAATTRIRKKDTEVEIEVLKKQLEALNDALRKEKTEFLSLYQAKDLLDQVTKETYQTARKISQLAQKTFTAEGERQLSRYLLLHDFFEQALDSYIREKSKELGVRAVIDKALIDEVCRSG